MLHCSDVLKYILTTRFSILAAAKDFQLVGHGKKILLFDIKKQEAKLKRKEAISYINALAEWNIAREAYASQVGNDDDLQSLCVPNLCC